MENKEPVSLVDDRQPFHVVDGEILTQRDWREKVRDATELLEMFVRQAHKDHTL